MSHASDHLPAALLADPLHLLEYRVELFNAQNRSAKPSAPVYAAAGTAPPDTGALRVTASRDGAVVEWAPAPASTRDTAVQLTRKLVPEQAPQNVAPPGAHTIPAPVSGPASLLLPPAVSAAKRPRSTPGLPKTQHEDPYAPVLLRAARIVEPGPADDAGGLLDPGVAPHATYVYTAERVRTVELQGHTLALHSETSSPVIFTNRDIFRPRAPKGLASVPSAPLQGPSSIDLSWEPSLEADLLGYNVYRADAPSGSFRRLNPEPLPRISFRDLSAEPGHRYIFRVTAVDQSHNESAPSQEIRELLPKP